MCVTYEREKKSSHTPPQKDLRTATAGNVKVPKWRAEAGRLALKKSLINVLISLLKQY